MAWHDDTLVCKASDLYLKAHRVAGTAESDIVYPAAAESSRTGDVIELRFSGELIAKYRVRTPGNRLRRLFVPGHPEPNPRVRRSPVSSSATSAGETSEGPAS
jgi:hypothetical protein